MILIKNLDVEQELVNGARGVIVDWKELDDEEREEFPDMKVFPVVKFSRYEEGERKRVQEGWEREGERERERERNERGRGGRGGNYVVELILISSPLSFFLLLVG